MAENEKSPVAFIVDDPPVNTTYWMRRQAEEYGFAGEPRGEFGRYVADWRRQSPAEKIPNGFWRRFAEQARETGMRGKFSMLPCPAGLGMIDECVEGYSDDELSELLAIVREEIAPRFDITPEIFTHTLAWDIDAGHLLPEYEHEWMARQDEQTLARYMTEALLVLRRAGFEPTGITQPCNFRADEDLYAQAVQSAMQVAMGRTRTFYFLHADGDSLPAPSPVRIAEPDADRYVVSITSGVRPDEPFWASLYGEGDPEEMADGFITADGRGRLADLADSGGPVVFHGHSQTLFSNGTEKGLAALRLVAERINEHLSDRVRWATVLDVAEWSIARAGA